MVKTVVQQLVEQQVNDYINNGGAEEALNNLVSSGQLGQIVTNMVGSGHIQDSISQIQTANENMPTLRPILEKLGLNRGLSDFSERLDHLSLPQFDSTEFWRETWACGPWS